MNRILREPLVHFFSIAALLFLAHHWVVGDPRVIELSAGTRAALVRTLRDKVGRAPTPSEQDAALEDWKRDEAVYREALREHLDRDDPAIRAVLIEKIRSRAALEAPKREPSAGDLEQWLSAHRALYETPRRYALDWVVFPKQGADASEQRSKYERAAQAGADLRFQGRPIYGATLTADELREKFGAGLAQAVDAFPLATWQRAESERELLLVRVNRVDGGLPSSEDLRARLIIDWSADQQKKDVARSVEKIEARYRFEERR